MDVGGSRDDDDALASITISRVDSAVSANPAEYTSSPSSSATRIDNSKWCRMRSLRCDVGMREVLRTCLGASRGSDARPMSCLFHTHSLAQQPLHTHSQYNQGTGTQRGGGDMQCRHSKSQSPIAHQQIETRVEAKCQKKRKRKR